MNLAARWLMQALAYGIFLAPVAYFSNQPVVEFLGEDQALIRLAFSHAGEPVSECRQRSQAELDELPPNMRKPADCPRERVPLFVTMRLDGDVIFKETLPPSGLWGDGETTVSREFEVSAGTHRIEIGMRDSRRESGLDYRMSRTVDIRPRDNIVVGFEPNAGGFMIAGSQP